MKLKDQYTKEIHGQFGYHATWLPGVHLKLGDIGVMDGNQFTRISSLEELGIGIKVRIDNSSSSMEYASENAVNITKKAKGEAKISGTSLEIADAGYIIEFTREKAILFQLTGVVNPSIADTISLGEEILNRFRTNTWKKEWVVITEIAEAETSTIVISNSANGKLELNAKGSPKIGALNLSALEAQFSVVAQRNLEVMQIARENTTPLFKLMGVRGWFNRDFGTKRMSDSRTLKFSKPEIEYHFDTVEPVYDEA